jgi:hypothetical protein
MQGVGPAYFATLGNRPLEGREFDENDWQTGRKIAVVNEAFRHEFLPCARNPVGRVLSFDDSKPEGGEPTYIVGLVRDILHDGVKEAAKPTIYIPLRAADVNFDPTLLVRGQLSWEAILPLIRAEVIRVDPEVAMREPRSLRERVDDSIYLDRLTATLSGFFGGLALLLAAVGIYGVMAYSVARRAGEIGLRIALGAGAGKIQWMVLRDGLVLIAAGIAIGLPLALASARVSASLLFGVRANDSLAIGSTVAVLLIAGVGAAWIPARRAAAIAPVEALRHE